MPAVVVTGGTGALGQAVVRALLAQGRAVAVPYRSASGWEALRKQIGEGAVWGQPADLSDADATASFVADAARHFQGLDGLAAIAGGYAGSGPLETAPVDEWRAMMRTNLDATWAVCRAALPHLLRTRGSVVTVASRLAEQGGAGAAAYAVSKAGVITLTRVLALENRDRGVRFNCVVPSTIDTPNNRASMPRADVARWTPPDAIAKVIAFLLSPAAGAVTGAVVPVDAPV